MIYVEWFVNRMKEQFSLTVDPEEVSFEAFDFYHEDLDDLLIPNEHLSVLPNPLLFETLMYVDEERFEWVAGVVVDEATKELLYEVWIKNGEQVKSILHKKKEEK